MTERRKMLARFRRKSRYKAKSFARAADSRREEVGNGVRCLGAALVLAGLARGAHHTVPIRLVEPSPPPQTVAPVAPGMPAVSATAEDCPYPINLATALSLAGVRPLDVALAQRRVELAAAQLRRA